MKRTDINIGDVLYSEYYRRYATVLDKDQDRIYCEVRDRINDEQPKFTVWFQRYEIEQNNYHKYERLFKI